MEPISNSLIEFAHQFNLGIGSNTLNIIILTHAKFSQQSCSRYFLANAMSNLFYSSIVLTYRLLTDDYRIDPARISIVWCKIIVYFNHLRIFLSPNFLVLAFNSENSAISKIAVFYRLLSHRLVVQKVNWFECFYYRLGFIFS